MEDTVDHKLSAIVRKMHQLITSLVFDVHTYSII